MLFYCLSFNHKRCPVEFLEKIYFSSEAIRPALEASRPDPDMAELLILSTCNRLEFYGFNETDVFPEEGLLSLVIKQSGIDPAGLEGHFDRCRGVEAVRHLFRVAAGLESLVIGENEILGQLRDAFRTAADSGRVHSMLYRLAEKALKAGKDVRTRTKINRGAVSVPSAGVELAEKIFGGLSGIKVVVLGTGGMAKLTLKCLQAAGADILCVFSRCEERGAELAGQFRAEWAEFGCLAEKLKTADIVIASTSAPHPVLEFEQVKEAMALRRNRPLCLVDIAMPRNIDPLVDSLADVYLYNMDDLKEIADANLRLRCAELRAAGSLVDKAVADFSGWLERLSARPTLQRFEQFLDSVLEQELGRVRPDRGFSEEDKDELRRRVRGKLLHPPAERIKEASRNGGIARYLEALEALFHLDPGAPKRNRKEGSES